MLYAHQLMQFCTMHRAILTLFHLLFYFKQSQLFLIQLAVEQYILVWCYRVTWLCLWMCGINFIIIRFCMFFFRFVLKNAFVWCSRTIAMYSSCLLCIDAKWICRQYKPRFDGCQDRSYEWQQPFSYQWMEFDFLNSKVVVWLNSWGLDQVEIEKIALQR